VLVDDNFHYMDENYQRILGEFSTYSEALAVCQEVVDRFLGHEYVPGMAERALYFRYMMFGQDPFIAEGPGSPTRHRGSPPGTTPKCGAANSAAPGSRRRFTKSG
jgi:hypothetical protein